MKRYFQSSISALAMGAMVMSGVAATVSITASPAFSQGNSAGKGNGGSNRNENSNRGDRDNNNGRGAVASSLGALNAAHANANALANASENSRVGMIAIYKLAVEATAEASAAFDDAETALATFIAQCGPDATDSSLSAEECQLLLGAATETAQLAAGDGVVINAFDYDSYVAWLEQAVSDAFDAEADAKALEDIALEAAANKVTNEEVIVALWDLLELPTE